MKSVYSRGQSLSEYALVLALIVAAVFGMQAYMKRGIQGVIKTTADTLSGETNESKEEGLAKLKYIDPLAITSLEGKCVVTDKTRTNLARERTTATGIWEFTYGIGDAGSFSASDKENPDTKSAVENKP